MKKNKTEKNVKKRKYDKNQLMVRIVAGVLVVLMMAATLYSVIYMIFSR